ncbi:cellulose synthase/poly-beta-1,6-N-acetylglucosamine synthase-like glycosyltransferase [Vibrio sp. ES.051]|uniref:glycosyltransferase family 2 protein n=1 Tax=Vibrio sp. ES.051 TaxID=1761909 RepID=UPI000C0139A2|nr:glycosyltransferase [Vibrio sp. ES.051]PFG57789.1 cellulose synthase/poly-beta-1,6-N-acetylglucosamine synthase-like glycosyltransferase [Vibrio sp. ES.051]
MLQDSLVLLDYLGGMLLHNEDLWLLVFPVMIVIELPLYLLVLTGIFRWAYVPEEQALTYFPSVSIIITCYGEGEAIGLTIDTLVEQVYPGQIEILVVVDGAVQNQETYQAALNGEKRHARVRNRKVRVLPKWQRGGRVSTLNAGLSEARGEIVINVDGDTSFDNDMVFTMMQQFANKEVVASGGALRVRNHNANLLTKMQSLEYMLSMQAGKTGMAKWGVLNNISGAFGAFRKNLLKQVGGWDTHTAEDLDLTMRLKQYKRRYPNNKLAFANNAIGHTDVPDTLKGLVLQRLRWDGDLLFLFLRKHNEGLSPTLLGWGNFLFTLVYGVIQNVLLPLLVVLFCVYMVIVYPIKFVLALMLMLYLVYLFLSALLFVVYIGLVSERKKEDLKSVKWLFFYPVYQFFMRLITAFSMVNEVVRRSHEESSMAPWWVLKRGKKF